MARIIAEFCQNHLGDRRLLREMIAAAAEAGADYAKIQAIRSFELTNRERFEKGRWENGLQTALEKPYRPIYERLRKLDLPEDTIPWFIQECRDHGIRPLITAFTRAQVPWLAGFPWTDVKVASPDCASIPFLMDLSKRFDHLFVSTGMTFDEEVKATADALRGTSFTLLHCVSVYPTPLGEVHLARMDWLRQFTHDVGFSDHTLVARDGLKASFAALALGATTVERHFTLLDADETNDGPVSITPAQLEELVDFARLSPTAQVEIASQLPGFDGMIGQPTREMTHEELLNRDYFRGRFASRAGERFVYNWEDVNLREINPSATFS